METTAELSINTSATALQMWQTILGAGATVLPGTALYFGDSQSSGIWSGGDATSAQLTPSDTGVILSTGQVTDVTNSFGQQNQATNRSTNTNGVDNDVDFNTAAGRATFDAAYLQADIVPTDNFLSIQFTFASEEYPEFVGTIYNDIVGIWVNGTYVTSPVFANTQINDLNENANETLYIDNTGDTYNTEMDGFTVTLSVTIPVTANVPNTLKIGIADVADASFDSAVLIAGNSVQAAFEVRDDTLTHLEGRTKAIDVLANDDAVGTALVTHINGMEVSLGDSVTLTSGYVITLTPAGTLSVDPPVSQSGLVGPESVNFTYTSSDGAGASDTGFVTVTAVPCFTAGTLIRTPGGDVPVELLTEGDPVQTRDHGPQTIRWIGQRRVVAKGRFAPIEIASGTFGDHARIRLSPQHRVLVQDARAEMLFGEPEVLVAAKHLVNDTTIRPVEGGEVVYIHMLFDRHEVVWSNGLLTESFLPGPQTFSGFDTEIRNEIVSLFPELDPETGLGYGPSARISLKSYEVRALLG